MTQTTKLNSQQFCQQLRIHLANKGYTDVAPQPPLDLAMSKQTFAGTIPKVIAVVDGTHSTDLPPVTFQRVEAWFKKLLGQGGAGILLFVYNQPPAAFIDEILKLGSGTLGYGQVVAGAYDLFSNKCWIPEHMNWPDEIFG